MLVRVYDFITEDKPKFADNLVGIIDDVVSFKYTRRAYDIGSFELTIPKNANDAYTIIPDRMIVIGDNTRYSYIVGTTKKTISGNALYVTEVKSDDEYINVTGYDLKYLLSFRVTLFPAEEQDKGTYGYYVTNGTTYDCIADLIDYNVAQSTDTDRQIYGMSRLTMLTAQKEAGLTGIQDDRYMTRLEPLTTAIFNILKNCKTHFYEVKLLIDDDKNSPDGYNPHMESGEDKPTIVISEDKYNIRAYTKTDDTSAYKNAIYAVAGNSSDVGTVVKLVKREDDTVSGVNRKEVVVDVDTDSVSEIDRYALRAAEEYTISDDFEIEPLFHEEFEDEPTLAQKVCIKIGNAVYETIITEITDEYTPSGHKVTYSTGNKKVKVLNVLNRAVAGNTQKIINNKLDMSNIETGVGKFTNSAKTSEIFNDYTSNKAIGSYTHVEGKNNGEGKSPGYDTPTTNHIEGINNNCYGRYNHVEGGGNFAKAGSFTCHLEGQGNTVENNVYRSHVEGYGCTVSKNYCHAEGYCTTASGLYAHSQGYETTASGNYSHAQGHNAKASGELSTADGYYATASGYISHAKGDHTTASGSRAYAEGYNTEASGAYSHAQNRCTVAEYAANTAMGKYNEKGKDLALAVGNGSSDTARSNALELDWQGNLNIAGKINSEAVEIATLTNLEIHDLIVRANG